MDYSVLSDRVVIKMDAHEEEDAPIIIELNKDEPDVILTGEVIAVGIGCRELTPDAVGKRVQLVTDIFAPIIIEGNEYSISEEKNVAIVWQ